ncbi:VRR-NUC domain-containing protein [Proteiniclasticum sp. C24MP]|uniref:VRR-NUC domain-containing protein n=1 Tax=Proteiniclasticum sp. C24MP TaxID=3374101 RepID=UPI00375406E8
MRESKVEKYLKEKVEQLDGMYLKFSSIGTNGVPDRIVILDHKVYFVELKATGKTPRKLQKYIHAEMLKRGFKVYVIDSFEGAIEFMNSIQRGGDHHEV